MDNQNNQNGTNPQMPSSPPPQPTPNPNQVNPLPGPVSPPPLNPQTHTNNSPPPPPPPFPPAQPNMPNPLPPQTNPQPPKKKSGTLIIVGVVVGVVLLGALVATALSFFSSEKLHYRATDGEIKTLSVEKVEYKEFVQKIVDAILSEGCVLPGLSSLEDIYYEAIGLPDDFEGLVYKKGSAQGRMFEGLDDTAFLLKVFVSNPPEDSSDFDKDFEAGMLAAYQEKCGQEDSSQ